MKIAMTYRLLFALYLSSYLIHLTHSQQCELYPVRPLGMTDRFNGVKDDQITASSQFSLDTAPKYARLHYSDGSVFGSNKAFYWDWSLVWIPAIQDVHQYLQIDFLERKVMWSLGTQGRPRSHAWVVNFYVLFGELPDKMAFVKDKFGLPQLFDGNTNDTEVKENRLRYPIIARYVRIYPQRWNRLIALRVEFFGCDYEQYTAFFDGKSRVDFRLDLPGRAMQSYNETIRFRFRTKESNGIIIYGDDGQGDYITVEMINGRLRVGLNLGSIETGTNSVYAGSLLDDDQWHDVQISRLYKMLNITVDRMEVWADVKEQFLQLNLNRNLSVAGLPLFTGKRGIQSNRNFTGCLENLYFNGLNVIRDSKNMTLLGPKVSRVHGFAVHGTMGKCKPQSLSSANLISFLNDASWIEFKKGPQGGAFVASLKFRTFQQGATFFFQQLDPNDVMQHLWIGILKGSNNITLEINYYDKAKEVYPTRVNYPNDNPATHSNSFSDGEWHQLSVDINPNGIEMTIDGYKYRTYQKLNLPFSGTTFIGGYIQKYPFFVGCMDGVIVNGKYLEFSKITGKQKEGVIESGSCQIRDYCSPNPCMHGAKCTPSSTSFTCDCSQTHYTGAVCYRPKYRASCSEVKLFLKPDEIRATSKNATIDLDGPGPLKPFNVTCVFTRTKGSVWTYVSHDSIKEKRVDGYEDPGSYKHDLNYNGADITALSEFVRRSVYCEQNIAYKCHMARLLARPDGVRDTMDENRAYGWWVGRRGQPRFYWGQSVPGHRKCRCGLTNKCAGSSDSCNCDSPGQISQDTGLLTYKQDLPVRGVRFGDTGDVHDNSWADYSVGRLECRGDTLFDNTVTFRKLDANITMKSIWSYTEFSLSFFFKTTQSDGVFFQNMNLENQHNIEVRLRQSRTIRFLYNVGFGLRVLDLKTTSTLNDNRWHIVRIERNRKEAALVVDEHAPTTLREPVDQAFRVFVFRRHLYVGSTADNTDGYLGCISNFMVNGVLLDLRGEVERGAQTYGVSAGCVPKCDSNPCLNRGECQEFYSHYYCECGLTPFRGYVCGREVGATFRENARLIVDLYESVVQNVGTVDEYIQIGFKTKAARGTLMQISSKDNREYIKVMLNTQCGITVYLDVGFQLREVTTNFNVRLCTDQHHTVIVWRSKEGRVINIKVDDYKVKSTDFSDILNPDSDTRLDNPEKLYIGRNATDDTKVAFEGCLYRMQFNTFFPLKMLFQKPANKLVTLQPDKQSVAEHRCGIEEVMPFPELIESKPFPTIPPNRTRLALESQGFLNDAVIAGIVLAVLFFLILIAVLFFCRNFTIEKGDYETNEAKGAGMVDHADVAIRFGRTGHPEIKGKEWWI